MAFAYRMMLLRRTLLLGLVVSGWMSPARADDKAANEATQPEQATKADPLLELVDEAILRTRMRYLDRDQHTPWQIMHGILALRQDYEIKAEGERISAIDWISDGATYQGEHWFEATPYGGRGHPFSVPYAFEGHVNQFLAILTMSNLPLDHEFRVKDNQVVTMADMVRHAQMFTNSNEETTWTLWFLTRYLEPEAQWTNRNGEAWSIERLVQIQTRSPVVKAPCGGTHQLFALSLSRNAYMLEHGRLRGAWLEADQKIQSHIAAAQSMQNSDGSFSTAFFKGRGFSYEFNERIKSSGHMLEWLMVALPERRLEETWVKRAVESVARDLVVNSNQPADCGPLYHALHALVLYRERVGDTPPTVEPPTEVAEKPSENEQASMPTPDSESSRPELRIDDGAGVEDDIMLPPPPPAPIRVADLLDPSEAGDIDEARPRPPRTPDSDAPIRVGDDSPPVRPAGGKRRN
ncbi:MAG: hypothetical protein DWQ34_20835 [Planctomycetota bacterium]|nr:MAG: hypothetical protein DWQ29_16365 [Planctomycetota bacterium]REJ89045.1 MAG: hypothetical protein DWQ34_20835 [Planctomycetota bacterium]REK29028.1 MAG: hypothetical protein DWQ41_05660 [Planctomycetota bacterium]REK39542.1 MAG: hypothetical protein DWQ45_01285 [Planctomycetota bacterium]